MLGKHCVPYFECGTCGFLRTEDPFWLDEAYSSAIARLDTGAIARNVARATELRFLLPQLTETRGARFLDFAGGHGVMVRLLRDQGLDFRWADKHAENHYASGFEWSPDLRPASAVTAVEVLEHVVEPVALLDEVLETGGTRIVLFTTILRPRKHSVDWWYLAPETGQHVGFHTSASLSALGRRRGLEYTRLGPWHVLSDSQLGIGTRVRTMALWATPTLYRKAAARRGLTWADHLSLRASTHATREGNRARG